MNFAFGVELHRTWTANLSGRSLPKALSEMPMYDVTDLIGLKVWKLYLTEGPDPTVKLALLLPVLGSGLIPSPVLP